MNKYFKWISNKIIVENIHEKCIHSEMNENLEDDLVMFCELNFNSEIKISLKSHSFIFVRSGLFWIPNWKYRLNLLGCEELKELKAEVYNEERGNRWGWKGVFLWLKSTRHDSWSKYTYYVCLSKDVLCPYIVWHEILHKFLFPKANRIYLK